MLAIVSHRVGRWIRNTMQSADVSLPIDQAPVFPDLCVVCRNPSPGHTVRIGTNAVGWSMLLTWRFGRRVSFNVPACRRCAVKLQVRRLGALILFLLLAIVVLSFIEPIVSPLVPRVVRRWTLMILLLICLSPYFAWEWFFPPAIELTAYSDTVDYEFRDPVYALQFASQNDALSGEDAVRLALQFGRSIDEDSDDAE